MDKLELENQIRKIVASSDEWVSAQEVSVILRERFGSEVPPATVRSRLISMVNYREIEFMSEMNNGHIAYKYKRAST